MPRQPSFKPRYRAQRDSWEVFVPKGMSGKKHNFKTKKLALEFSKNCKASFKKFGESIAIPSVEQIKEFTDFQNQVGDNDIREVAKVGIQGVSARITSVTLKELKPYIKTALRDDGDSLDSGYVYEMIRNVDKLIECFGDDTYVSDFTPAMIDKHIDDPKLGYSLNHKAAIKRALTGVFKVASDNNLTKKNPVHGAKRRAVKRSAVQIFIEGATPEMRPVHICGFGIGLRPCEIRRFKYDYIDHRTGEAHVPAFVCTGARHGKTVYISDNWMAHLEEYEGRTGYVSPLPETEEIKCGDPKKRKSISDKWRRNYWNKDLKQSGMWEERIQDGTRHTFGTMTYWYKHSTGTKGEDALTYVKQQLGHYDQKGDTAINHYVKFDNLGEEPQEYFSYFPDDGFHYGSTKSVRLERSGTD